MATKRNKKKKKRVETRVCGGRDRKRERERGLGNVPEGITRRRREDRRGGKKAEMVEWGTFVNI